MSTEDDETRRFESEFLALPPLKMVLVDAKETSQKRPVKKTVVPRKSQSELEHIKAVVKLIDHLMDEDKK